MRVSAKRIAKDQPALPSAFESCTKRNAEGRHDSPIQKLARDFNAGRGSDAQPALFQEKTLPSLMHMKTPLMKKAGYDQKRETDARPCIKVRQKNRDDQGQMGENQKKEICPRWPKDEKHDSMEEEHDGQNQHSKPQHQQLESPCRLFLFLTIIDDRAGCSLANLEGF